MDQVELIRSINAHVDQIHRTIADYCAGQIVTEHGRFEFVEQDAPRDPITSLLHDLGVPAHIVGYRYLRDAIRAVMADSGLLYGITTKLYPGIAEQYGSTPTRVERGIRHAIELGWGRDTGTDTWLRLFGSLDRSRPTNSEFVAVAAEWLKK